MFSEMQSSQMQSQGATQEGASRERISTPSTGDWERVKSSIYHLYYEESLPLAEVQSRMWKLYDFNASYVTPSVWRYDVLTFAFAQA